MLPTLLDSGTVSPFKNRELRFANTFPTLLRVVWFLFSWQLRKISCNEGTKRICFSPAELQLLATEEDDERSLSIGKSSFDEKR